MEQSRWIMSEGGPLIAIEQELQPCWGGICRLTVPSQTAANDYERTWEFLDFIQTVDLHGGLGLIFGEGPLDTTIWQESDKHIFVVRVIYCDPDFDANRTMYKIDPSIFACPVEQMQFQFLSGNLLIFDSTDDGSRPDVDALGVTISPGIYIINTITYDPDHRTSLIVHEFINAE